MEKVSKETRSRIMRAVRPSGNRTTEWKLRAQLVALGVRGWHMLDKTLPGTPDFVFPVHMLAVFVDGCFWHGCPRCYRAPSSNRTYWRKKIETNRARDRRVSAALRRQGWRVWRVWECKLEDPSKLLVQLKKGARPKKY